MNMRHNAFETAQARRQYIHDGDNRERLADETRKASARPNRIMNVFQRLAGTQHNASSSQQETSTLNDVARPVANS